MQRPKFYRRYLCKVYLSRKGDGLKTQPSKKFILGTVPNEWYKQLCCGDNEMGKITLTWDG